MWETLSSIDRDDLYAKHASAEWRPMLDLLNDLRQHPSANRLSAYTSHFQLVVTFAIGYVDQQRADRLTIDYKPKEETFTLAYLRPFTGTPSELVTCGAPEVLSVARDFVGRLVSAGEVKSV